MTDYKKVYEKALGIKWDRSMYNVHHIDQDRSNNDISNLLLLPSDLHHRFHLALYGINEVKDMKMIDFVRTCMRRFHTNEGLCINDAMSVFFYLDDIMFWVMMKELRYRSGMREYGVKGIEICD